MYLVWFFKIRVTQWPVPFIRKLDTILKPQTMSQNKSSLPLVDSTKYFNKANKDNYMGTGTGSRVVAIMSLTRYIANL